MWRASQGKGGNGVARNSATFLFTSHSALFCRPRGPKYRLHFVFLENLWVGMNCG